MLKTLRILAIFVLAGGIWLNTYGQITGLAVAPADLNGRGEVDVQNADISWTDYTGEDHYFIDIRTGSPAGPSIGGSYPVNPVPANTTSHTILDALTPGTTYYFVIEARDAGDILILGATGSLSFFFANAPDNFNLLTPANAAVNQLNPVLLSWQPASPSAGGSTTYTVQYYEGVGAFPGTSFPVGAGTSTSSIIFSLGATVTWRVVASDGNGGTTISTSSRTFTMWDNRTYPVNGSTGHPLRPRFEWDVYPLATSYEIQVDDNSNFGSPLVTASTDSLFYDLLFDLDNSTTYYWRLRITAPFVTPWSAGWSFVTTTSGRSGISYPVPSYPVNGVLVYVADPLLSWYLNISQVGITSYLLEYKAGDDDFSVGPVYSETSTNLFFQVSGLSASTDYYWRVRAYNGTLNLWSSWSDTAYFATDASISGAPTVPTPLYPVNNVIVYHDDTPLLHWYVTAFNDELRFDVEVDRVDPGPVYVPVFSGSTTTSQFYLEVGTQLEAGEQYRWRVRSTRIGFPASGWSSYAFFTMDQFTLGAPVQPTPLYPVNNATVYTGNPTLHWYITSYIPGVEWDIQVQGVSAPVIGYNATYPSSSYQYYFEWPDELVAGEDYQWRVRSKRTGYPTSAWSGWATFNVYEYANGVPVKPTPVWPVGNATVYLNPPLLSWYISTYVPGILYEVEVKPFLTPFNGAGTFLTGSYQQFYQLLSALTPGAHYHWRVRSYVAGPVYSSWSDEADFTIDANNALGSLPQPQLVYPTGGISVYVTKPILSWYTSHLVGVTGFRVRVATDPLFFSEIAISPISVTTMHYHFTVDLVPGTTYYWRVESTDGLIYSTPSMTGEFTVEPGSSAPVVPKIGGPDGIDLQTTSANLSWFLPVAAQAELSYEVEYSTQKDFSQSIKIDNITASNYTVTNLKAGTEYYWRVRSVTKENQSSGYSFRGTFVPAGVTGVEESGVIPEKFEVGQNYPNPFNPVTNIRVNMPESGILSIKIFNILGQEVMTLINQEMNAGVHTLQWKGENNFGQKVPSGTYIYRVTAGSNSQTMKMVLLK